MVKLNNGVSISDSAAKAIAKMLEKKAKTIAKFAVKRAKKQGRRAVLSEDIESYKMRFGD